MATLRERCSVHGRDPIIREYETTAIVRIVDFKRYTAMSWAYNEKVILLLRVSNYPGEQF